MFVLHMRHVDRCFAASSSVEKCALFIRVKVSQSSPLRTEGPCARRSCPGGRLFSFVSGSLKVLGPSRFSFPFLLPRMFFAFGKQNNAYLGARLLINVCFPVSGQMRRFQARGCVRLYMCKAVPYTCSVALHVLKA